MDIHLKTDEVEELKGLMAEDGWTGSVKDYAREVFLEGMSYHKARQAGGYLHGGKVTALPEKRKARGLLTAPGFFRVFDPRVCPSQSPEKARCRTKKITFAL